MKMCKIVKLVYEIFFIKGKFKVYFAQKLKLFFIYRLHLQKAAKLVFLYKVLNKDIYDDQCKIVKLV